MSLQPKLQAFTGKERGKHAWDEGEASLTPTRVVENGSQIRIKGTDAVLDQSL